MGCFWGGCAHFLVPHFSVSKSSFPEIGVLLLITWLISQGSFFKFPLCCVLHCSDGRRSKSDCNTAAAELSLQVRTKTIGIQVVYFPLEGVGVLLLLLSFFLLGTIYKKLLWHDIFSFNLPSAERERERERERESLERLLMILVFLGFSSFFPLCFWSLISWKILCYSERFL